MNFTEFLTEETNKELFTIVNVTDGSVPKRQGEVYQTYAVTPSKAKWQLIHRIKQEPDKYAWKVINNPDDYEAITWDQYKKMVAEKQPEPLPEPGPVKMRQDPQMTLFDDPKRMHESVLLVEETEENLEDMGTTEEFPQQEGGGKFDYVIVDSEMNPDPNGDTIFVGFVTAEKNPDMTPKRGTRVIQRLLQRIPRQFPNVNFIAGKPTSDGSAEAFKKTLGYPNIQKNEMFKVPIR